MTIPATETLEITIIIIKAIAVTKTMKTLITETLKIIAIKAIATGKTKTQWHYQKQIHWE